MLHPTLAGALLAPLLVIGQVRAAAPALPMQVFARTTLRLTDIVWTGKAFLYVDNTTNRVSTSGPSGAPLTPFATMPRQVEETRCAPSPGAHGFPGGEIFCHAPDNTIYRISADGKREAVFAKLPATARSDGALAFDTVGAFGYALIVATGRSGGATPSGGSVYAVSATGAARRLGTYSGPGGADEIALAPAKFGVASGDVLLAVDAGSRGTLVAMDPRGRTQTLAQLPDGPNPIAVIGPSATTPAGAARPGLYVTDTLSRSVYLAPAAQLRPYTGGVLVGSELRALFWVLRPRGSGFAVTMLPTTLPPAHYNLEGATYIG